MKIRAFLETFDVHLEEHDQLLGGNEIFQMRVKGIGAIDRAMAIGLGLTGANLRASGVGFDVRRDRPYDAYRRSSSTCRSPKAGTVGSATWFAWKRCVRRRG